MKCEQNIHHSNCHSKCSNRQVRQSAYFRWWMEFGYKMWIAKEFHLGCTSIVLNVNGQKKSKTYQLTKHTFSYYLLFLQTAIRAKSAPSLRMFFCLKVFVWLPCLSVCSSRLSLFWPFYNQKNLCTYRTAGILWLMTHSMAMFLCYRLATFVENHLFLTPWEAQLTSAPKF